MFDTFIYNCVEYRSQAFGQGSRDMLPGTPVVVVAQPLSQAQADASAAGRWQPVPALTANTYQAWTYLDDEPFPYGIPSGHADSVRYLEVENGSFTGVTAKRNRRLPFVDYRGHVIEEPKLHLV